VHAGADGGGAVHFDIELDGGRNRGLQTRQLGHYRVNSGDHVRARSLEYDDENGVFEFPGRPVDGVDARDSSRVNVGDAIDHRADVGEAHRRAGQRVVANDDGRIFAGLEHLIVVVDLPAMVGILKRALGPIGVGVAEGGAHGFKPDAVRAQLHGVRFHTHGGLRAAAHEALAHALNLRDLLRQDGVGHVVDSGLGDNI
jgi:hypothetical protein